MLIVVYKLRLYKICCKLLIFMKNEYKIIFKSVYIVMLVVLCKKKFIWMMLNSNVLCYKEFFNLCFGIYDINKLMLIIIIFMYFSV